MITNVENQLELADRHFTILHQVFENEPIGIVALSKETGYPEHKVRYSLRILEENGLIEPTHRGAIITERTATFIESSQHRIDELISKLERLKPETDEEPYMGISSVG